MFVNAYDAITIYSYAKQHNMSEAEFIRTLEKENPEMADAFKRLKDTKREDVVRKMLTLTRDIKGIEVTK
jgi:predicted lipase